MKDKLTTLPGLRNKKGVYITLVVALLLPLVYTAVILTASWGVHTTIYPIYQ